MIAVVLADLRWRILLLALVACGLYALEPGFHQHDDFALEAVALGPLGVSATLAYLAAISMIVLLAGFVSSDRREGYTRLYFSHPTSPLAYYGLRWGLAYAISLAAAVIFLVVGQLIAWGAVLGGWRGLVLPAVSALIYGGLIALLSVTFPRGDGWLTFLVFLLPTFFPQILTLALDSLSRPVRQVILFILPPHGALQDVWDGLVLDSFSWDGIAFAAAYGALLLAAAAFILTLREWP